MKKMLMFPLALVVLAAVIVPLATATRQDGIPPNSVVFSKGNTPVKTLALVSGEKVDVVWKDGTCSNGFVTPPVAMTFSGPTLSGGVTDATAPPIIAPCSSIKWPDDWECILWIEPPKGIECHWTYKGRASGSTLRAIPNPGGSENANLFLYKRTVLFALVQQPGTTTWKKVAIPPGANAVRFYGPHGG